MDAAQYLFLPASADLSRLAVTVHTQNCTNPTVELQGSKGIEPLGETVNITELAAADDGLYTLPVRINGEAAGTLCVAQSRPVTVRPSTCASIVPSSSDGANAPSGSVVTVTVLE